MENIENKINQALLSLEALVHIKETYNNNVSLHHSFVQDFNSVVDKQINITKMTIRGLKKMQNKNPEVQGVNENKFVEVW